MPHSQERPEQKTTKQVHQFREESGSIQLFKPQKASSHWSYYRLDEDKASDE
jgi:hypothetical protein